MKRRYFLKNKRRFYTIISVIVLVTIMLSSFLVVSAHDGNSQYSFDTVVVKSGDTLWNIAKEYNPNGDIRKFVYEIKKVNDLNESIIYVGEELKIPVQF